jgi:erythritol/L-threitol dehydrogenase
MTATRIPDEMLSVRAYGPKDYRLEQRRTPRPGPGELLVRISACGVCGSDIHAYHGAPSYWGNEKMAAWMKAPVTPGHEFFGEVAELGEGAAERFGVKLGDRVIAEQIIPCNRCKYCLEGDYHLCMVHNMYGFQKEVAEGGMAEYMRFGSASKVHVIPPNVTTEEAAVIEPLSCSIHAVERASIGFGDFVVVAGAGPIGLFIIQLVHLKTPKKLLVLDVNERRLQTALTLGADLVMNPAKEEVVPKVLGMTGGYGCDVYIEASGSPEGVIQGLNMMRKKGRFVEFSVFSRETTVDWSVIGEKKELDVLGAHISPNTYPIAIDLLSRKLVKAEGVVTHKFPLKEFKAAFQQAEKLEESVKVLLLP